MMMGPRPQCYIPSHKVIGSLVLEKKIFEGFLPYKGLAAILVMWPRSREHTFVPHPTEAPYEIWLWLAKRFWRRRSLKYRNANFHLQGQNQQLVSPGIVKTSKMSLLMRLWYLSPRLWYLSHRRPAKDDASLYIHAVSPEPSLFTHMKYGRRWRVCPKSRHLTPLDLAHACLKNEVMED